MSETCDARIRPFPNQTEVACGETGEHPMHLGKVLDYAYPGSVQTVEFHEDDRRTYHGEWPGPCPATLCPLPLNHRGEHVI